MELFKIKKDIPIMRYARITTVCSFLMFLAAVASLATRGLNLGVDFTGGTIMELAYPKAPDLTQIRAALTGLGLHEAQVQNFGSTRDVLIRLPAKKATSGAKLSEQVLETLQHGNIDITLKRVDFVGPQVGRELYENGALALLAVCAGIMCYLMLRFEWKFSIAAIIANLHDVIIIIGFFSFFQWEFTLPVLAAILAILGYSVNESVVVFDRIRENFRTMRTNSVPEIIDNAITRTMSRTVITHAMTQLMVFSMLIFGGETLFYFALALTIGILFGIYSSVLVASPIVMWLGVSKQDLMPARKEGAEADARP